MRCMTECEQSVFESLVNTPEAIRLFYSQICLQKGLPFEVKIPNATTIKALRDSDAGRNPKRFDSVEALIHDLEH